MERKKQNKKQQPNEEQRNNSQQAAEQIGKRIYGQFYIENVYLWND